MFYIHLVLLVAVDLTLCGRSLVFLVYEGVQTLPNAQNSCRPHFDAPSTMLGLCVEYLLGIIYLKTKEIILTF